MWNTWEDTWGGVIQNDTRNKGATWSLTNGGHMEHFRTGTRNEGGQHGVDQDSITNEGGGQFGAGQDRHKE